MLAFSFEFCLKELYYISFKQPGKQKLETVIPGDYPVQHRNNWKIPEENCDKNGLSEEFRNVQTYQAYLTCGTSHIHPL